METAILGFVSDLIKQDILTSTGLLLLLTSALVYVTKFYIIPIFQKTNKLPETLEIQEMLNKHFSKEDKILNRVDKDLKDMISELYELLNTLEKQFSLASGESQKDLDGLRKDVERVKEILNQFQGHMMYNQSNKFGNRELR